MAKGRDRTFIAVACVVVALGLTVYGYAHAQNGGGSASPSAPTTTTFGPPRHTSDKVVLDAWQRTTKAKTALARAYIALGPQLRPLDVSISGSMAFNGQLADFTYSIDGLGDFEVRLIKPDLYVEVPTTLANQLPPGKSWVGVTVGPASQAVIGANLSQVASVSAMCSQYLMFLGSISAGSVEELGPQTLQGLQTTEYQATVDLSRAAAREPRDRAVIDKIEAQTHDSTFPVQVWVDGQGQVSQLAVTMPLPPGSVSIPSSAPAATTSASSSPQPLSLQVTLYLYDFGVPVQVAAPPAAQVDKGGAARFAQPL